ncbi:MAG: hypothetical protein HY613_10840 [Candidatus Rokubacteria bacterium]|nr:hypothetical protein [Candidatus Rokubacteria bacterium]
MIIRAGVPLALVALLSLGPGAAQTRDLIFEERVLAQRAIERVYYAHQIGATRPFEEAVPPEVVERKVRTYLKQSVVLDRLWQAPVTAEALHEESERIAQNTRLPERLSELYAALDNDPTLIQEALVRPVLVDRLAREFFAADSRIHAAARKEAEDLRARLVSGELDVRSEDPHRTVVELVRTEMALSGPEHSPGSSFAPEWTGGPLRLRMGPEEFARWRSRAPELIGEIDPVIEEREVFKVQIVIAEDPERVWLAIYTIAKTTWDAWWDGIESDLDDGSVRAVAGAPDTPPAAPARPVPERSPGSVAAPMASAEDTLLAPVPRAGQTAVWTGNFIVIWGGYDGSYSMTGFRYDPVVDSWTSTATRNAPAAQAGHRALWTGNFMAIWGGYSDSSAQNEGQYDPVANAWPDGQIGGRDCVGDPTSTDCRVNSCACISGGACSVAICQKNGRCKYEPLQNGTPCSDGNSCTADDTCQGGVCAGGPLLDCNDGNVCTTDSCDPAIGCLQLFNSAPCDDGRACTTGDTCSAGLCIGVAQDFDGDGYVGLGCGGTDCNDTNSFVWLAPVEVTNFSVSSDSPTDLTWNSQAALAGPETAYDLVSGSMIAAHGLVLDISCLQSSVSTTYRDGRTDPPVGSGFWYLVRARNCCGNGTYGSTFWDTSLLTCP